MVSDRPEPLHTPVVGVEPAHQAVPVAHGLVGQDGFVAGHWCSPLSRGRAVARRSGRTDPGLGASGADGGHPDATERHESREHVPDHPGLGLVIPAQTGGVGRGEELGDADPARVRVLQVIAGHVAAGLAPGGGEVGSVRVAAAAGEQVQRAERMAGPAFAQVDLHRVRVPGTVAAGHDEVDAEPADHPFGEQPEAHLLGLGGDQAGVLLGRRKAATDERLPVRSAQHLVVGGDQPLGAARQDPQLHAGAGDLVPEHHLLDDPGIGRQPAQVVRVEVFVQQVAERGLLLRRPRRR